MFSNTVDRLAEAVPKLFVIRIVYAPLLPWKQELVMETFLDDMDGFMYINGAPTLPSKVQPSMEKLPLANRALPEYDGPEVLPVKWQSMNAEDDRPPPRMTAPPENLLVASPIFLNVQLSNLALALIL